MTDMVICEHKFATTLEAVSIDEAFLDVRRLQEISTTKLLAKVVVPARRRVQPRRTPIARAATATTAPVLHTARALLSAAWPLIESRGLTLVGITMSGIEGDSDQLVLPLDGHDETALDDALDRVRDRFGTAAITRAALLGADAATSAWLLPGEDPDDQAT